MIQILKYLNSMKTRLKQSDLLCRIELQPLTIMRGIKAHSAVQVSQSTC